MIGVFLKNAVDLQGIPHSAAWPLPPAQAPRRDALPPLRRRGCAQTRLSPAAVIDTVHTTGDKRSADSPMRHCGSQRTPFAPVGAAGFIVIVSLLAIPAAGAPPIKDHYRNPALIREGDAVRGKALFSLNRGTVVPAVTESMARRQGGPDLFGSAIIRAARNHRVGLAPRHDRDRLQHDDVERSRRGIYRHHQQVRAWIE